MTAAPLNSIRRLQPAAGLRVSPFNFKIKWTPRSLCFLIIKNLFALLTR